MDDQSQKNEMREAIRGDRKRALERWRDEGRQPVFGPFDEPEPDPEPQPELALPPEEEPEPVVTPAAAPVRTGWLSRLFRRRGSR